ncbi:AT-rich interactive domain-containing protein 5B [Periophthalmus magnuspinnatus]|uniref:AT-rich interactive domain-containing protein 5B n=1 Tax=Periophthalmus magnuspinnatus TaxID=409849 RepID=UPI00145B4305|nr:AT-rich interactive domain-containing protein 5B [Periophthalmus magnuspinnatus]
MEHNAIQWLGAPSCQRGTFSFYKSVGSRTRPDGPVQTWRLGEFYFIRCGPQEPVCLAEVTLLWEDQTQRHLLASARLYFLPEDTPKGRTRDHGEDEVLAVSRKMVVKVEDLVRWSCLEDDGWKFPRAQTPSRVNGVLKDPQTQDPTEELTQNPTGQIQDQDMEEKVELKLQKEEDLKTQEVELKKEEVELKKEEVELKKEEVELKKEEVELKKEEVELKKEEVELKKEEVELKRVQDEDRQWVKVLSYPQYCRYRSLQRRTQGEAAGLELQDPHILALGGLKVALSNTRVMYCRDTFNHPTLENNASFSWQFRCPSLSLRGRPRKRKGRDGKDSPTSSQSESWIDRMQENVMGSVESGCEGAWLPHPDEQFFLDQLFSFMDKQGAPIHKVPNLGFKKIDLFRMYSVVKRLGGYEKVTNDRLWKIVYNELGGCPGSTSAATCTRRHYERLMLPYEEHLKAGGIHIPIPEFHLPVRPKGMRGRKPGRKPGPKPKDKKPGTPSGPRTIVNPDGTVVVKRGRGRPPGKKNKATLIAQAKLLAQQQAKHRAVTGEIRTGPGFRTGPGIRTGPGETREGAGRGRPPTHPSLHRVPPLHTPQPIAPALIPVNMPLTPDLSPRSTSFLPFQPKPQDPNRPESSSTNNTSSTSPTTTTTTTTTTAVPAQGLLLSALPHHFVSGFSPIKGLCPLDVFRNRIQRGLENPGSNPQDPQHLQPSQHQIVYSIQPKMAENPQTLSQNQDANNRNRLPLPPLRVLPLDLDCSVQVRQLMRTRLGSTQFQTFTRRLSEALSHDGASKPVPCSPITPPPEQNLPLNLSKRLPQKRAHPDGAEASFQGGEEKRQRQHEDFGARLGQVGRQELRVQEEPADLSSPSRIRAFLLGLPPFQVKLEEDLNGGRFPKLNPESRRLEVENLGMKKQDDDVIIVEDDRDEDEEEQESVVFVKEEFNGKEVKGEKISEEKMEVLKQAPTLVLAQHS